jgi:hypothetical protein
VAVETHRFAFPALASDLRHADYLIPFAGGYHAEILRFLVDASACVLHFEFGILWGIIREIVNGVFRVAIGVIVAILSTIAFFGFILWLFTL